MSFPRTFRIVMILAILTTSLLRSPLPAAAVTPPEGAPGAAPAVVKGPLTPKGTADAKAPLAADLLIYADSLAAGWEDWSWDSTVAFDNPTPSLSGPASIAVTFNAAYAGFSLRTAPPLSASDFQSVSFFVYAPGTDRSLSLSIQASDDGDPAQHFDFNAPADQWSQIVIGLDSLGNPGSIARINISDNSGAPQPVFYLDQISLLGTGSGGTPDDIPAVIPGAPRPSLTVSMAHGYTGQALTASGQGPTGLAGGSVRLAWLFDGATFAAGEAPLTGNAYSASLTIPSGAPEGPARLCAALTGLAQAAFTCTGFVIDPPPPAQVSGQLVAGLVDPAKTAQVQLLNFAGDVLRTAPVSAGGSFSFGAIKPGFYRYAVVGGLKAPAKPGVVEFKPGLDTNFPIELLIPGLVRDPVTNEVCDPSKNQVGIASLSARYTDRGIAGLLAAGGRPDQPDTPAEAAQAGASPDTSNGGFKSAYGNAYTLAKAASLSFRISREDLGTFISGVPLNNTFTAELQQMGTTAPTAIDFHIQRPDGSVEQLFPSPNQPPYSVNYNVGQLPPGTSKLIAAAVVNGTRQCPLMREISVAANPLTSPPFQPDRAIAWKATGDTQGYYTFSGSIPYLGSQLPLTFPSNPLTLPYLGNIQSRLGAGLRLSGEMHLDGMVRLQAVSANAQAVLLGRTLYNNSRSINTGKTTFYGGIDPSGWRSLRIATGRQVLWSDSYHQDVFNGIIFSFLGIVNVGMTVKIGMSGEVVLDAVIYPFQPNLDLTLTPSIGVYLTVSVWVNLLVLASAGADAIPSVSVALPLRVKTNDSRRAWFEDPCIGVNVDVKVWVKINYLFDTWRREKTYNVLREDEPDGCVYGRAAQALLRQAQVNAELAPPNPRVMASPDVATNPYGQVLAVYVDDLTPGAALPTPAVMGRFKDPESGTWLPAVQLSSGDRAVNDPVAAFFGEGNQAMVAWSQTELAPAEETPAEDALPQYLNHLEIYTNYWNGQVWSGPQRLTDDLQGDGFPALAGDAAGASLAWVRDGDGNSTTQADTVIAVRSWSGDTWGPLQTLQAAPSGLNAQVSVSRYALRSFSQVALAWVYDADGSPTTLEDRRVQVAINNGINPEWGMLNPQPLPPRVTSVSVLFDPHALHLAFTSANLEGDEASAGAVSDNLSVWVAQVNLAGTTPGVIAHALNDEQGQPVRGERPRLQSGPLGEVMLTFRRFGALGSAGQLGQVAVSSLQSLEGEGFSPPVYLTGGLSQHWQSAAALNFSTNRLELMAVQRPAINLAAARALGGLGALAALQTALPADVAARQALEVAGDGTGSGAPAAAADTAALSPQALQAAVGQVALLRSLQPVAAAAPNRPAVVLNATAGDPLLALSYDSQPDPALDADLALSQAHAAPGTSVTVTATVRNLGRAPAPAVLRFYRGFPGSGGVPVSQVDLGTLAVGEVRQVNGAYTVQGGEEPVYAEISPATGGEASAANNIATAKLGQLPPAGVTSVLPSQVFTPGFEVAILPAQAQSVAGYRVLRSAAPGGPYELAGETTGEVFYDLAVESGQRYCYVAQAYDRAGQLAPYSNEICSLSIQADARMRYLPVIHR